MHEELSQREQLVLRRVKEHPGSSIKDTIQPLIDHGASRTLRHTVRSLARRGYIKLDATKRTDKIVVTLTKKGREHARVGNETHSLRSGSV